MAEVKVKKSWPKNCHNCHTGHFPCTLIFPQDVGRVCVGVWYNHITYKNREGVIKMEMRGNDGARLDGWVLGTSPLERQRMDDDLRTYVNLERKAEWYESQLESLRSAMAHVSSGRHDGMPRGNGFDPTNVIAKAVDMERLATKARDRADAALTHVTDTIDLLDDPREVMVCDRIYVGGLSVRATARNLGYSERHVKRLHQQALAHLVAMGSPE